VNIRIKILIAVAIAAAFGIGLAIGIPVGNSGPSAQVAQPQTQLEAAKQFSPKLGTPLPLAGTISAIGGNVITLIDVADPDLNNTDPTRDVVVTASTTILRRKAQAVIEKETAEYQRQINVVVTSGGGPVAIAAIPQPSEFEGQDAVITTEPGANGKPVRVATVAISKLTVADLHIGDRVSAAPIAGTATASRFEAATVSILVRPPAK